MSLKDKAESWLKFRPRIMGGSSSDCYDAYVAGYLHALADASYIILWSPKHSIDRSQAEPLAKAIQALGSE